MATQNEIKNLALFELGFVDEVDFTDLTSATVKKVNRIYDTSKKSVLAAYYWRFIMKREILSNPIQPADTFTAVAGTDILTTTSTDRYMWDTLEVTLSTTGTLPAGLALNTTYYVISASNNTCQLAATSGDVAIDITDVGTGTHTITFSALNKSPYKYLFNTPSDALVYRSCFTDKEEYSPITNYEYNTDGFFTNDIQNSDLTVRLWYSANLDETLFPEYFINYFKYFLALDLCYNLTGNTDREKTLLSLAQLMLSSSKKVDAKQVKTRTVKNSPLVGVRGNRGSYSNGIGNV